jgi:hypothetical protein
MILPPMVSGAARNPPPGKAVDAYKRAIESFVRSLRSTESTDLIGLEEQALRGLGYATERASAADQRANFFLGATGLTTSLVLANSALLIGENDLKSPWHGIAVGVLAFASACGFCAGVRAVQASMLFTKRLPPEELGQIFNRRKLKGDALRRDYVAALLTAQSREIVVGTWKLSLVASARRWFSGVIFGVVALTLCVLFGEVL